VIEISVNRKKKKIREDLNFLEFLAEEGIKTSEIVSTELNGVLLAREEFGRTVLKSHDEINFLYFTKRASGKHQVAFETLAIQDDIAEKDHYGSMKTPIYTDVSFQADSAEDLELAFRGKKATHVYSRVSNPSVQAFELKLNQLEKGEATIAVASGMSAILDITMALTRAGENVVIAKTLFGGTISLLKKTLKPFGLETRMVDITDMNALDMAIDDRTRFVFFEAISNPLMIVADIRKIVKVAKLYRVPVIIDSTLTTPYLLDAKCLGVNVVIHSTTKLISGGATSLGGAIVDIGNFHWENIPALEDYRKFGSFALISKLRLEVCRNVGACLSPYHAYQQSLGLETLAVRMEKSCKNAQILASYLESHQNVRRVNYPGLKQSAYYSLAQEQFFQFFGTILSFELRDKSSSFLLLNRFKVIRRATNLGDNRSLAIHPASTIFATYSELERLNMGISEGLIRLSVGIENVQDLIQDLAQGLTGGV